MNKKDYIAKLSKLIHDLPKEEKEDILFDYEEHFRIGLENGRNEEEIAISLGEPKTIARQIRAESMIKEAEKTTSANNIIRAIFAAVGLGFFNLVIVLGPAIGLVGILIGLFAAALSITVSGGAILFVGIFDSILEWGMYIPLAPIVSIPLGIGLIAIGLLFIIGVFYLSKIFYGLSLSYLKMNLQIITDRRNK